MQPIVKATGLSYVGFCAPDLDKMRTFLELFGLVGVLQSDDELFMRGAGEAPFIHRTKRGDSSFDSLGIQVGSKADLERLAEAENASIEDFGGPGGGLVVRLEDPDGFKIDVLCEQEQSAPLDMAEHAPTNSALTRSRKSARKIVKPGPASVMRLGHCVFDVSNVQASLDWYQSRFGFLISDSVEMAPGAPIGAFLRCDLGSEPTDHHTLFIVQGQQGPRFNHAAFEVADMDDLMRGHNHLLEAVDAVGHKPSWGVGRHVLGSQIFDYWYDPFGNELEHWTDGDLFSADDPPGKAGLLELIGTQWGPESPFMKQVREMEKQQ